MQDNTEGLLDEFKEVHNGLAVVLVALRSPLYGQRGLTRPSFVLTRSMATARETHSCTLLASVSFIHAMTWGSKNASISKPLSTLPGQLWVCTASQRTDLGHKSFHIAPSLPVTSYSPNTLSDPAPAPPSSICSSAKNSGSCFDSTIAAGLKILMVSSCAARRPTRLTRPARHPTWRVYHRPPPRSTRPRQRSP